MICPDDLLSQLANLLDIMSFFFRSISFTSAFSCVSEVDINHFVVVFVFSDEELRM